MQALCQVSHLPRKLLWPSDVDMMLVSCGPVLVVDVLIYSNAILGTPQNAASTGRLQVTLHTIIKERACHSQYNRLCAYLRGLSQNEELVSRKRLDSVGRGRRKYGKRT